MIQSNKVGNVISLFITAAKSKLPLQQKELEVDEKGILLDKHYDKDTNRSILITSADSYDLAQAHDIKITKGALGENLLIDYNPYSLSIGTKLRIGTAVLAISQNCTLCSHLSAIDTRIPKLLKNDRGIFARVIEAGKIKEGDTICLLAQADKKPEGPRL